MYYLINIIGVGQLEFSTKFLTIQELVKQQKTLKSIVTKFLKKNNIDIFSYINQYITKLQLCGFCNKNFAKYNYTLDIVNNNLIFKNIQLYTDYMCTNKQCKLQRAHLNPNSFEHISKRKKISLQEADKWMKSHNKSPFYKHPWDTDQQYSKRQARSLDYFIEKYENGKQRWYNYCKKISNANKQQQVIKRHGEEYNTRLQNSKKQTLQNFILRYGQIEGKQKYINWITAATQLGIYINNKKIQSKSAYNFFKLLEIELINNNICKSQDILFADGNKSEYILKYFEDDKFKFYKLDFVILKYKIDIQFNGRAWHYDFQNEQKNKYFVGMKKNIKQYEYKRNTKIKQEGFNLFIVWEDDIFNEIDKKKTIQKLILDIKQIINAENSNEKLK